MIYRAPPHRAGHIRPPSFGQDLNDISVADFHVRFVDVLEDVGLPEHNSVLTGPHAPGRGPRVRRVRRGTL